MKTTRKEPGDDAQFSGPIISPIKLWADTSDKIFTEWADLSAAMTREGVRLYADLQSAAVRSAVEWQDYWTRGAKSVTESVERLRAAGEKTALGFRQAFDDLAAEVKELYAPVSN